MKNPATSIEEVSRALALEVIRLRQKGFSVAEAYIGIRFFADTFSRHVGRHKMAYFDNRYGELLFDPWWVDQDWVEC